MTLARLVLNTLLFHWRGNLPVALGVALGTAVLTGALLVGDSLRGSLRDLALEQLGWVDHALVSNRFVHQSLASQLGAERTAPAILLRGSATHGDTNKDRPVHRAGHVVILGVDEPFWHEDDSGRAATATDSLDGKSFWSSDRAEVVLNQALAGDLAVKTGDEVTLSITKVSDVPRETLLGRRDVGDVLDEMKVTVRAVIPNRGLGRFSLNPSPAVARNAFLPLRFLQNRLHQQGKVNALLIHSSQADINGALREHLTLDDWGIVLRTPAGRVRDLFARLDRNHDEKLTANEWRRRVPEALVRAADRNHDEVLELTELMNFYRQNRSYFSLESRQLIVEPAVADAALAVAQEMGLTAAPTLVYLANSISDGKNEIPYSIVAALDPKLPAPLGPFLPSGVDTLKDGEILLADWKDSPLQTRPGEPIRLSYFPPEESTRPQERSTELTLRGIIPLSGAALDPDLTPEFPGITDKLDIRQWNPPFPFANKRVKPKDERYWEEYRTTPKAYVTLSEGTKLWASRFGGLTSIRLALNASKSGSVTTDLDLIADEFAKRLLARLQPEQGGLVFDAVRERSLGMSSGSADFGGLFIGFSLFLIVAALLLVGLLYRLGMDRRSAEIGLLSATGYRRRTLLGLLVAEGGLLAVIGGAIGLAAALGYTWLVLSLFRAWWPGGLDQSFLTLHVEPMSFAIGHAGSLLVSLATIGWSVRALARLSTPQLLAGETAPPLHQADKPSRGWSWWITWVAGTCALLAIALAPFVRDHEMQAMSFFAAGALVLIAALAGFRLWINRPDDLRLRGHGQAALARLGVRNAARYPARSLLTAGLLAFATFTIVAIESFYKSPGADFSNRSSGSGGFTLLAESDVPIYQDLSSTNGWDELGVPEKLRADLKGAAITSFRLRPGDDASCLNLYAPRTPRLLGAPRQFLDRGGFQFSDSEARSAEERANPWLLLEKPADDGSIPVIGDANTVKWILHSDLGKALQIETDEGRKVQLRIVGLLQDSIFQSELLLSQPNFLALFPRQEGYRFFLVDTPPDRAGQVRTALETALADHGLFVSSTTEHLQSYLAVENTYLQTFQALGGLGLALGALGLAVVLTRTVWERRGELALLRAMGFRQSAVRWLVLAENAALLILGLAIGTAAALAAVAPQIFAGVGQLPWSRLAGLLLLVLAVGLIAGWAALRSSLRAPLLEALRRE
jgi:ABC-type lipoprotein release transport system permease subunit